MKLRGAWQGARHSSNTHFIFSFQYFSFLGIFVPNVDKISGIFLSGFVCVCEMNDEPKHYLYVTTANCNLFIR